MKLMPIILSVFISIETLALDLRDVTQVQLFNVGDGHLINKKPVKNFVSILNSEFSGVTLLIKNDKIIIKSPNKDYSFQSIGDKKIEGRLTSPKEGSPFSRDQIKYSRSFSHTYGSDNVDRIKHVYEISFGDGGTKLRLVANRPTSEVSRGGYDLFNTLDKCVFEYKKGIIQNINFGFNENGMSSTLNCSNGKSSEK